LLGSLELIAEAGGIDALRAKSLVQTSFLMGRIDNELTAYGVRIVTPREAGQRGGHVAITVPGAWKVCQALKAAGVVVDFRNPDIVRLSPSPLFTSYAECAEAVARLRGILDTRVYETYPAAHALVP
jgi:kynureninase